MTTKTISAKLVQAPRKILDRCKNKLQVVERELFAETYRGLKANTEPASGLVPALHRGLGSKG